MDFQTLCDGVDHLHNILLYILAGVQMQQSMILQFKNNYIPYFILVRTVQVDNRMIAAGANDFYVFI